MEVRSQVEDLRNQPEQPAAVGVRDEDLIHVSPATRRVAFAYERFRNTLEPDEEDILRRKAIFRILERRLAEDRSFSVTAEQLLQELIRANYTTPVTHSFANHISIHIDRTRQILSQLDPALHQWFLRLVVVTLDRDLFPHSRDESLVQLMYQDSFQRVEWVDDLVHKKDRATQLYIAVHRALFEADDFEITHHYFIHTFPAWNEEGFTPEQASDIAESLPDFYQRIQNAISHPERERLSRLLRGAAVPYRILRDLLDQTGALDSTDQLEAMTRQAVTDRVHHIRTRMNKRAWHSILFLFFTKSILTFLLEVPYEAFLLGELHYGALIANIAFHPLLLFFLATTVRLPGEKNIERIVEEVEIIATGEGALPTIIIRNARNYGAAIWTFFALFYAVLFLAIFWGLFTLLDLLQFSLIATFMFVMFLGLVSFLAIRIRRSVNEIRVIPSRESTLGTLITFLSLPMLEFGRWLALHISQLNVALFFMDRVLEAPFKILIDVTEEWFTFVRERREEIV